MSQILTTPPFYRQELAPHQITNLEAQELLGVRGMCLWGTVWRHNPDYLADMADKSILLPLQTITFLARQVIPTSSEYHKLVVPNALEKEGVLALGSLLLHRGDVEIAASRLVVHVNSLLTSIASPYRL